MTSIHRSCQKGERCSALHFLSLMAVLCCALSFFINTASAGVVPSSADADYAGNGSAVPPFAVFGYLPEYRQLRFDYEAVFKSGLTHLIFFSAEIDPVSLHLTHVDDRLPSKDTWRSIRALADQYGVRLMLCIGGGGRSEGFAKLVGDVLRRKRFIQDVGRVVQDRGLDGIDFNWEYPASMTEWLNFGQFLVELRSFLNTSAIRQQHSHRSRAQSALLTMALHPHPTIPNVLRASRVLPSLDYLHWMAYDHMVANDSHSSFAYAASVLQDSVVGNLDDAVYNARLPQRRKGGKGEVAAATPAERLPHEVDHRRKLCLGIPFYGRHREDMRVPPESYEHLWQFIRQWAAKLHPSWAEGGPELRAMNSYAGYDYNGYEEVKRKMRLARSSRIAGIMIWELGQDIPPGTSPMSLMTAIHEQLSDWTKSKRAKPTAEPLPVAKASDSVDDASHEGHARAALHDRPPPTNAARQPAEEVEGDL